MKGIIDIDTTKGCTMGMRAYPQGGCYGECYAYKNAVRYGFNFSVSVSRKLLDREHINTLTKLMQGYGATWYRIGTAGDPCHDWENMLVVCKALRHADKIPVIITKHWIVLSDDQIRKLKELSAVVNTSTSGLDSDNEIKHRIEQLKRLRDCDIRSICRVVTCNYGTTGWARERKEKQDYLMSLVPIIDNPLRIRKSNIHVVNGDIIVTKRNESVGCGGKYISLYSSSAYLGKCKSCPDQCGINPSDITNKNKGWNAKWFQNSLCYFPTMPNSCA